MPTSEAVRPLKVLMIDDQVDLVEVLRLAFEALERGGISSAVLNAANEVAVAAFLDMKIDFPQIAAIVGQTMARIEGDRDMDLEVLLEADREARNLAQSLIAR